ncbi:MAG: 50S ribosomal protein L22 [Deltaproteobacteria bacterium]|jgi:large subunit ribosomal protein L22|nr:50S ribosomal protein L22 [Deltaproteobacteria bacterium]
MSLQKKRKRHELKIIKARARKEILCARVLNQRGCPDKFRIVGRTIIGKSVVSASAILKNGLTKASFVLNRCLTAAIARATNIKGYDLDDLFVKTVTIDRARMLKRIHPVSHGMAKHILKRSCHVTVIVSPKPNAVIKVKEGEEKAN